VEDGIKMSHYIILCEHPGPNDERKMREHFLDPTNRDYHNPPHDHLQIREIKLYNFCIPEGAETKFKTFLQKQHLFTGGEFKTRGKLMNMLLKLARLFGLKDPNITAEVGHTFNNNTKYLVLGKMDDYHDPDGRERF